jgi:hypothetical protein
MRWGRRTAALAVIAGVLGLRAAGAQSVTVSVPVVNDSISPAPPILVEGTPGAPTQGPYSLSLEVALEPQFRAPIIIRSAAAMTLSVQADSLLPEHATVYFRGRLIDGQGQVVREDLRSFHVRSWLRLVSPTRRTNDVLFTRQPQFIWSSPGITLPPGPWSYQVSIVNTKTGAVDQQYPDPTVKDTLLSVGSGLEPGAIFVPPTPLEACTSYSWRVTARATNGSSRDQVTVSSPGTFVIQTAECPTATIFYQNFPNPFGRGGPSDVTCFWFDLARDADVKLTIYDIRLRVVRSIVPGTGSTRFAAGAYGRQGSSGGGCDARFSWDGRDNNGRAVPSGVYIAAFEADGVRTTKKILFLGQ